MQIYSSQDFTQPDRTRGLTFHFHVQFPVTEHHPLDTTISPLLLLNRPRACSAYKSPVWRFSGLNTSQVHQPIEDTITHKAAQRPGRLLKARGESPNGWGSHLLFRGCWHADGQRQGKLLCAAVWVEIQQMDAEYNIGTGKCAFIIVILTPSLINI